MITVYHNPFFMDCSLKPNAVVKQKVLDLPEGSLVKVADIQTDDLGEAFELTNNIDHPWHTNANVSAVSRNNRSTSVGDVMDVNGKRFIVAGCGWIEL